MLIELHDPKDGSQFPDYSYDLKTIAVGRDRDCVNNVWDLYQLQSKLLFDIVSLQFDVKYMQENPRFRQDLLPHLINNIYHYLKTSNMQTYYFRTHAATNKSVCDIFYRKHMIDNDKDYET